MVCLGLGVGNSHTSLPHPCSHPLPPPHKQVLQELPDKLRRKVPVPVSDDALPSLRAIKASMDQLQARVNSSGGSGTHEEQRERQQLLTAYYQRTGPAKVEGVIEFVREELIDKGRKVGGDVWACWCWGGGGCSVISSPWGFHEACAVKPTPLLSIPPLCVQLLLFAHHHSVLDALESRLLQPSGVQYIRIDGTTATDMRKQLVDRFQDPAAGEDQRAGRGLVAAMRGGGGLPQACMCACV